MSKRRKITGSVLLGEVALPSNMTLVYQPPGLQSSHYRQPANTIEATLDLTFRQPGPLGWMRDRKISILVEDGELKIDGPTGSQRFKAANVQQVFTAQSGRASKIALVVRVAGRDHVLIEDLRRADQVHHIEQALEEFLGIDDQRGLDIETRLAAAPSRIVVDSKHLRAAVVEREASSGTFGLAHLRVQTKRPNWGRLLLFGFLAIHNTLFFGGMFSAFGGAPIGIAVALAAVSFWSFFAAKAAFNETEMIADDHTLQISHGPISFKKHKPITLADVIDVESRKTNFRVNNKPRYRVVLKTNDGEIKVLGYLGRKPAQVLARILRRQVEEARVNREGQGHDPRVRVDTGHSDPPGLLEQEQDEMTSAGQQDTKLETRGTPGD